ncbi:hypothetical protein DFS34DRAFT_666348 [Phlyctochytrium arcticum]|nr:hypothetical protein DFS34DRAFT_666348 [Phlyctochytrium arcticum]
MNETTRIGAMQLVKEAIAGAPQQIATYLTNYWTRATDLESWSMAARQHSPILLQVRSTNALELYHRLVKAPGKCTKRCGLLQACRALVKVNKQRWLEADHTAKVIRSNVLKLTNAYPEIRKFPYPIQRLLITQYMALEKRIAKGKPTPQLLGDCHCLLARQSQLPCKHIFHADSCNNTGILTPARKTVSVPVVLPEIDRARDARKRKVKAAGEPLARDSGEQGRPSARDSGAEGNNKGEDGGVVPMEVDKPTPQEPSGGATLSLSGNVHPAGQVLGGTPFVATNTGPDVERLETLTQEVEQLKRLISKAGVPLDGSFFQNSMLKSMQRRVDEATFNGDGTD